MSKELPDGWDDKWRAALENTDAPKARVWSFGASYGWSADEWPEWAIRAVERYKAKGWIVTAGRYGFAAHPPNGPEEVIT